MRVIAGNAHGRRLSAPRGFETRPATARVRASIFSRIEARRPITSARVLDIFAGSGSLGIEALSRGAESAVFVDSSRAAITTIGRNLDQLGFGARARVIAGDFRRVLASLADTGGRFDLIFVDSPYTGDVTAEVLALLTRYDLIAAGGYVVTRQFHRAASAGSAALECASTARLGDHRIALYRRLAPPAPTEG